MSGFKDYKGEERDCLRLSRL